MLRRLPAAQIKELKITEVDTLLVLDMQQDFISGTLMVARHAQDGRSEVPGCDALLPVINALIKEVEQAKGLVVYTQDYHPKGHKSFASSHKDKQAFDVIDLGYGMQTLWPDHCVQVG